MADCDCKLYGNQHGSFYRFCEKHTELFLHMAGCLGETTQDLFDRIIREYCERVKT